MIAIVWIVLLVVAGPLLLWMLLRRSTDTGGRVRAVADGIEIAFRPHVPVAAGGFGFLLCGFFATFGLVGSVIPSGVLFAMAGLFLVLPVGALGTVLRSPRVLLTREGLDYRGWGADAFLAWDDIARIDSDVRNGFRPLVEIIATQPAPSFRYARAIVALPEPMGPCPAIRVVARGLDEPWRLMVYVEQMAAEAPARREARLGAWGLSWLDGTLLG
ncbi:MAG: hypothetical protein WKF79_02570 [Nocardioides sp.]